MQALRRPTFSRCLPGFEDKNRPAFLIVAGVKPIPERKSGVAVRLVYRFIVEMVNWDGQIVGGIESRRVNVESQRPIVLRAEIALKKKKSEQFHFVNAIPLLLAYLAAEARARCRESRAGEGQQR
jgi:hypothetical protein